VEPEVNDPVLWVLLGLSAIVCFAGFLLALAIAVYALRVRGRKLRLTTPTPPMAFGRENVEEEIALLNWQRDRALDEVDDAVDKAIEEMERAALGGGNYGGTDR
jgi:hypothetical protein